MAERRITIRQAKDAPGFYVITGGGKTLKVAGLARAREIAAARRRLRAKGKR
ncbi:MAG: hypothetical protein IVW51_11115 [Thermaceae bacterium]|nr:hypothetical protein [Thermaceae bacterium]